MSIRLPAAERRQQLVEVAIRVFAANGFHDTSMNDVAEAAGVTKPVLYQHFGSKRELFAELLREAAGRMRDAVAKATAEATGPREQVENGFRAFFGFVEEEQEGYRILYAGDTRRDPEFAREAAKVESDMADAVAELILVPGMDLEHRRLLAFGIVGIAEVTSRHWLTDPGDVSADELAAQAARLAWAGLRGARQV